MNKNARGFTIVELLIVIVVIGILAAITIVAYNGIQNRANDAAVKSDANAIAKKLEMSKIETGIYPMSQGEFPAGLRISNRKSYSTAGHNVLYCLNVTTDQYGFGLMSKSGKAWLVVSGEVRSVSVTPSSMVSTVCNAVGASWAHDANNRALQGYHVNTGQWNDTWSLTK